VEPGREPELEPGEKNGIHAFPSFSKRLAARGNIDQAGGAVNAVRH